jgi:hypothetical protein
MIQEYLPGQNIAWDSFWYEGNLIASYSRERIEYPFKHISPSGITGTPTVSKIIVDEAIKLPSYKNTFLVKILHGIVSGMKVT